MKVRVLGCSGAIAKDCRTTSFLIGDSILLDAGTGVGDLTLEEMMSSPPPSDWDGATHFDTK